MHVCTNVSEFQEHIILCACYGVYAYRTLLVNCQECVVEKTFQLHVGLIISNFISYYTKQCNVMSFRPQIKNDIIMVVLHLTTSREIKICTYCYYAMNNFYDAINFNGMLRCLVY